MRKREEEEERKKKAQQSDSEDFERSVISRQPTKDSEDSESESEDSDSESLSSNASSTVEKRSRNGVAGAVSKPKIKDVEVPDTMRDMQATFSGIFGENQTKK